MKGIRLMKRLFAALTPDYRQTTYAQYGEDLILRFLFHVLKVPHPTYLDIGAHHPAYLSNTYLFYLEGSSGVCVEPDPLLHRRIKARRPRDICLNIGITAGNSKSLKFYVFDNPTMNTFSEEIKNEQVSCGRILKQELQVEVLSVNDVIVRHFFPCPNLISLDTEGMDMAILQEFDFHSFRPDVFCIETLTNSDSRKMNEIIDFVIARGYVVFADTYLNTIFVENERWNNRGN